MPIKLQGKEYKLVSERLAELRERWPNAMIHTDLEVGQNHAFVKATIEVDDRMATGHSLCRLDGEKQVEKCETVAVGRALALLDPSLAGTEIASADEIQDYNRGTAAKEFAAKYRAYGLALQRNLKSCAAIQEYLDNGELPAAWEAWNEIEEGDRQALRVAATKGGWLSVEQGKRLAEASAEDFDPERGVYRSIADG